MFPALTYTHLCCHIPLPLPPLSCLESVSVKILSLACTIFGEQYSWSFEWRFEFNAFLTNDRPLTELKLNLILHSEVFLLYIIIRCTQKRSSLKTFYRIFINTFLLISLDRVMCVLSTWKICSHMESVCGFWSNRK